MSAKRKITAESKPKVNKLLRIIVTVRRILAMMWNQYPWHTIGSIAAASFAAISPFLISGSQGLLINNIQASLLHTHPFRWVFAVLAIVALALPDFVAIGSGFLDRRFYFVMQEYFEILMLKKRATIDVSTYESSKFQNLINRVNEKGAWILSNTFLNSLDIVRQIVTVILAGVVIAVTSWKVFILIVICMIPHIWANLKYSEDSWFIWGIEELALERRKFWEYHSYFKRTQSLIEMRLLQAAEYFLSMSEKLLRIFNNKQKQLLKRRSIADTVTQIILEIAFAISFVVYLKQVIAGSIGIGTFTFVLASIGAFQLGLIGLSKKIGDTYENALFAADFIEIIDMQPLIIDVPKAHILKSGHAPEIIFENISFKYPNSENFVYKNFSLTIKSGEKLALIGINGAGKTTLIKLLCRFYRPTSGRILIDGIDLQKINIDSWYEKLGILFQDYGKYNLPVDALVGLGDTTTDPSKKRVKEAIAKSDATDFVEKWPKKYSQQIGNEFEGVEPSIGQWQKLALARVFYREPEVWILDEPTSSIDAEAEAKIFEKLEKLPNDKTVILVSHRFSTVRNADVICVIQNGQVIEHGSHEHLIGINGEYARLFAIQAQGYK